MAPNLAEYAAQLRPDLRPSLRELERREKVYREYKAAADNRDAIARVVADELADYAARDELILSKLTRRYVEARAEAETCWDAYEGRIAHG